MLSGFLHAACRQCWGVNSESAVMQCRRTHHAVRIDLGLPGKDCGVGNATWRRDGQRTTKTSARSTVCNSTLHTTIGRFAVTRGEGL